MLMGVLCLVSSLSWTASPLLFILVEFYCSWPASGGAGAPESSPFGRWDSLPSVGGFRHTPEQFREANFTSSEVA